MQTETSLLTKSSGLAGPSSGKPAFGVRCRAGERLGSTVDVVAERVGAEMLVSGGSVAEPQDVGPCLRDGTGREGRRSAPVPTQTGAGRIPSLTRGRWS